MLELRGGDITLESEVGSGTTATIIFPADRVISLDEETSGGQIAVR
jgi:signal transduction histidine kinase